MTSRSPLTLAVIAAAAVALSAGSAAAKNSCADLSKHDSAGTIIEVKRSSALPAKSCVDGKISRLEPGAVMGQRALRQPSGGYFLPDLNYSVSAAHVEVSEKAEAKHDCRSDLVVASNQKPGSGLGHGACK